MAMAFANARQQYLKTQVETASKEQLVVMLFDGILRFTEQARKAIREKAIEDCHNALMRAEAIVMELIVTVDKEKGGEIATNLIGLHAYAYNALVQCNLHKDESKIDEVQGIYRKLREGWVGAMASLGIGSQAQQASAATISGQPTPPSGKPLPTMASAPKATGTPLQAPKAAAPAPQAPAPAKPMQGNPGIMASAAAARPASAAPSPAPTVVASSSAAPQSLLAKGGYGMGRTAAMLNAYQPQAKRSIA